MGEQAPLLESAEMPSLLMPLPEVPEAPEQADSSEAQVLLPSEVPKEEKNPNLGPGPGPGPDPGPAVDTLEISLQNADIPKEWSKEESKKSLDLKQKEESSWRQLR